MDSLKLDERIMELIDGQKFDAAEAELHQAKLEASNAADHQALDHAFRCSSRYPVSNSRPIYQRQKRTAWNESESSARVMQRPNMR